MPYWVLLAVQIGLIILVFYAAAQSSGHAFHVRVVYRMTNYPTGDLAARLKTHSRGEALWGLLLGVSAIASGVAGLLALLSFLSPLSLTQHLT